MDAVEFNCLGSNKLKDSSDADERVSLVVNSILTTPKVKALESASSDKVLFSGSGGLSCHDSEVSERNLFKNTGHVSPSMESEGTQRKRGKVLRSSNSCPKRPRITHDPLTVAVVTNGQISSDQLGSHSNRSISLDRTLGKQKNGVSSKRGERRNSKLSLKAKYDAFPLKAGSASFSSAAGGNGFFGAYGLKTDSHDLTELSKNLSVDDLLNGSYEVPTLGRCRERRPMSTNENIMVTFRKACSILQLHGPIQSRNFPDANNCSDKRASTCLTSASADASGISCIDGGSSLSNESSSNKDPCSMDASLPDQAMSKPIHVLEKLGFPPPKDLESLLLDASKSLSRTTSDLRTGKQICRRTSLPPFPWSQTFNGHHKNFFDALKSPLSRTTCQGRWAKIVNIVNPLGNATGFTNLESLTYDQSLVPSGKSIPDESGSASLPWCDKGPSSFTGTITSSQVCLESGVATNSQECVEQCPTIVAAAQTLHKISTLDSKSNLDEGNRSQKKPSQKSTKARKPKSDGKPEDMFRSGLKNLLKNVDRTSSKKSRISLVDPNRDTNHIDCVTKGAAPLSTSILSRSSPTNKSSRDSIAEARYSTASMIRHSCMLPPPPRVLDKANGIHR